MTIKTEKYPSDFELSIEDFETSGWEEAFENKKISIDTLVKKSHTAFKEGKLSRSEALLLLADVCSMRLNSGSITEPFKPFFTRCTERSTTPHDFSDERIDYLTEILPLIKHSWLRARLADLIWFRRRSRTDLALTVIDSYLEIPLTLESFLDDGNNCWKRAIQITRILKHTALKRTIAIQHRIWNAIHHTTEKDDLFAKWLSDLLREFELGCSENEIAEKLVSLAEIYKAQKQFPLAREYYDSSSYWYLQADKEMESFRSIACKAELWHVEAKAQKRSCEFHKAANSLEKAIQLYSSIPQKYRNVFRVGDKLPPLVAELGKLVKDNSPCNSLRIEMSVTESRQSIQGKAPLEALKILANLYPGAKKAQLRSSTKKSLTPHVNTFYGLTIRSHDGRVVSQAIDLREEVINKEMLQNYYFEILSVVPGRIIPALEIMNIQHRLQERDFISLCNESSIIPPSRTSVFTKALFAGYNLDFDSAFHKLAPEIEILVRYHLKAADVITTTIDRGGEEVEIGLSALLEKSEAAQIFGEDLVFEMGALFCEGRIQNFRHHLARGLLENGNFCSAFAVYAWNFALRLTLIFFWNSCRKKL